MTAPSVGSVGTPTNPSGSTTAVAIPVPASVVSGSVVVVVVYTDGTSTITGFGTTGLAHAPGSPLQSSGGGGNQNTNVLWKRASGADSGTYALTQSAAVFWTGGSARIDNAVASGNPWDANSGTGSALNTSASSASLTTSMTTGGADELLFNAAGQFNGGTWTAPTSFTKDFTDTAAPGVVYFGHLAQAAAGATGTLTTSVSGGASQMTDWLGALLPVSGGATYVPPKNSRAARPPVRVRHASTTVPPAQVFVPQARRRRPTPTLVRRGRAAQVVPPQVVVVAPPQPPQFLREKIRWFASRRGEVAQVVPPQVVVPPPPVPPQLVREKLRWFATRRGEVAQVVPPQIVAPPPVYVPPAVRSRGRFLPQRRPRVATTPPAQVKPPMVARIRLRLPVLRRSRPVQVVPPQVIVVPPPYRPRGVFQKLRQLVFRRPRFVGSGWMVGADQTCTTPRPGTGTTAYNTATTARPNTGTTDDPC